MHETQPFFINEIKDSSTENGWIRDDSINGLFIEVQVLKKIGLEEVEVKLPNQKIKTISSSQFFPSNSIRFDACEDVSHMTILSEATVLHNLKQRYDQDLIYTYSGLFLVAINPYKPLPIYSMETLKSYQDGSNHLPSKLSSPHIFAIANKALKALVKSGRNQSILITGESGAGKTENTKKVIQFLTTLTQGIERSEIEKKIHSSTPILEAFGNAQTVRNNNSSRFGKFVKIEFSLSSPSCAPKIIGANIVKYLLEKGRVTHRSVGERNFHIFYQLIKGSSPEEKKELLVEEMDCSHFTYLGGGGGGVAAAMYDINGIDDINDFMTLKMSFKDLGFSEKDQMFYFKILISILFLGNLEFENDDNDQAFILNEECHLLIEKVCKLLNLEKKEFLSSLLAPTFIAGRDEIVHQRRTKKDVKYSVEAICRSLYDGMFDDIVRRINQRTTATTATDRLESMSSFIGVLDIAGFEIFENNSFEQLLINHTNERLQQFFNHHMFIKEQEEYEREMLPWTMIDFGLDLQPTIDCLENKSGTKIGILALLDEECLMPQATDHTLAQKIMGEWQGNPEIYSKDKFITTNFSLKHYAGCVEYKIKDWIFKNKDPQNISLQTLLHRSLPQIVEGGMTRSSNNSTLSLKHREGLLTLIKTLSLTDPHFVRCIVPNHLKIPSKIEASVVLEQLKCNGVLEGIRIAKEGYPNRLEFMDFKRLFEVLHDRISSTTNIKQEVREILEKEGFLEGESYLIGQTKIFIKGRPLALLEERRNQRLNQRLKIFQLYLRSFIESSRKKALASKNENIMKLKIHIEKLLIIEKWSWNQLLKKTKPLFHLKKIENEKEKMSLLIGKYEDTIRGMEASFKGEEEKKIKEIVRIQKENEEESLLLREKISSLKEEAFMMEEKSISIHNDLFEKEHFIQKQSVQIDSLRNSLNEKDSLIIEKDSLILKEKENLLALEASLKDETALFLDEKNLLKTSHMKDLLEMEENIIKKEENMNTMLQEMEHSISILKEEISSLKLENHTLLKRNTSLEEEVKNLLEREKHLYKTIKDKEEINVNIMNNLMDAKVEISSLTEKVKISGDDILRKENLLLNDKLKIETLTIHLGLEGKEIEDLHKSINDLECEGQKLKENIFLLNKELSELLSKDRKQIREDKILHFEEVLNQIQRNRC